MTRQEFVTSMIQRNWIQDRWGHLQKLIPRRYNGNPDIVMKQFRIKIQAISCRVEIKSDDGGWIRVGGAYYRDTIELPDGKIQIGSSTFGGKK